MAAPDTSPKELPAASVTTRAALVLLGFTAAVAQIVLMRELLVVFYGNELSLGLVLACWLFWTAFGSGVLGRLSIHNHLRLVPALLAAVGLTLPLTIAGLRSVNTLIARVPGEMMGPAATFVVAFAVLSVFCSLTGWLFAAGSRLYARETERSIARSSSNAYLFDAAGSALGGLLASLLLIRTLNSTQVALLLATCNVIMATVLLASRSPKGRRAGTAAAALLAAAGIAAILFAGPRLEQASLARLWRGFTVLDSRNSTFGNLAVVEAGGSRALFENGAAVSAFIDPSDAEESVHFALLQHAAPRSLLLIGGGATGSLAEALKHRTLNRVDYVEPDPAIISIARRYFPVAWAPVDTDLRVRVHSTDGRLFLKTTGETFDVIIVNVPDPRTAQLNRFYTIEFFREAAARLSPSGVLSFRLTGAENYISPELAEFLRCMNATLREVFPVVSVMPGGNVHFFASKRAGVLAGDAGSMLARLRQRQLETEYVREYYLPFRLMPDRVRDLESQIAAQAGTPINRDFAPIAYYFDVVLWSSQFGSRAHGGLAGWFSSNAWFSAAARVPFSAALSALVLVMLVILAIPGIYRRSKPEPMAGVHSGACVAAMGFTLMALELLLLLAFQALYGFVYQQLALLIAGVMAGMAVGTWAALRPEAPGKAASAAADLRVLAALQGVAATSALVLCGVFAMLGRVSNATVIAVLAHVLFPLLALACGLMAGYQFPVASRLFLHEGTTKSSGALYALDLAGACLGALLLSAYLVPVFGFVKTAWAVALVNLIPGALVLWESRERFS